MPTPSARAVAAALLLSLLAALLPLAAAPADAAARTFASCAAVHAVYSGGIAKAGVTKNAVKHANGSVTKRALEGRVLHSTASWTANRRLDRDRDGIACEKG